MDERLEKALAFSNYHTTLENRRKALLRRFESMLILTYENGMFSANQELISFVDALLNNDVKTVSILDVKNNPIEIQNLNEFQILLIDTYTMAMNEYSSECKKINTARNVKKIMDW